MKSSFCVVFRGMLVGTAIAVLLTSGFDLFRSAAIAQVGQAQAPGGLQDYCCWKERRCDGSALTGNCNALGFFCTDDTCTEEGLCSWYYSWQCVYTRDVVCTTGSQEEISTDCAPYCKLISYNQCGCSCKPAGPDTIESGPYFQCFSNSPVSCIAVTPGH